MKNTAVTTARVLIIDDDRELGEMLKAYLQPEQFVVDACLSGEDGIETLRGGNHDIVILDIMLPGMNGLEVLKQIRDMSDIPTIMLTAKGDDVDRILGLELGADDYLAKPFNPRELLARLKATLRRAPTSTAVASRLAVGAIELDIKAQKVVAGSASIRLTGTEFELLRCLAEAPGEIISKDDLSNRALGRRHMPYDRSIDTHMSNVRRKLGDAGVSNPSIQSRRSVGYCLLVEE
ncbi:MAG: response regulator transcription factor [Woeseiaceae bacterium]